MIPASPSTETLPHPRDYGVATLVDAVAVLLDPDQRNPDEPLLVCGTRIETLRQAQEVLLERGNGRLPNPEAVAELCAVFHERLGVEIPAQSRTWPTELLI